MQDYKEKQKSENEKYKVQNSGRERKKTEESIRVDFGSNFLWTGSKKKNWEVQRSDEQVAESPVLWLIGPI